MRVFVVDHNPKWKDAFEAAAEELVGVMGPYVIRVHHIGSTAIPSIYAKPVIDLMPEVNDINEIDRINKAMEEIGYEAMGEYGISGRRYFRRNDAEDKALRTHNVHTFQTGSEQILRHLAFRDFMRSHPHFAHEYSELKRRLAKAHPDNIEAYMDGKDAFIKDMEQRALNWVSRIQLENT